MRLIWSFLFVFGFLTPSSVFAQEEDEEAKDRSRVEGEERFYPLHKAVRRAVVHRRSS